MWKLLERIFGNPWFGLSVITAFAGMISYFQINSYSADKHHLNGFWLVTGIVFTLVAGYCMYKAKETSTGTGG